MEIYTVEKKLKKVALKAKILLVIYGIFKVCVVAFLYFLGTFIVDFYIPDIPAYVRLLMLFIGLGWGFYLIYKHIIKVIIWKPTSSFLAGVVEGFFKDLNDALISAVDFAKKITSGYKVESRAMMVEVIKTAIKNIKEKSLSKVINLKPVGITYLSGFISLALTFYITHTFKDYSKIWWCRIGGGSCKWPQKFKLELYEPKPQPYTNIVNVGEGDKLKIVARSKGITPKKVLLLLIHPDNRQEYFYMNRLLADENKDKFIYELINITKNFSFYFKSGDIESPVYRVVTFPYPTIEKLTYKIKFPPYTRRKDEERTGIGNIDNVPTGSTIEMQITSNVPISYGIIEFQALPQTDKDKKKYMWASYIDRYYKLNGYFLAKKSTDFSIILFAKENPQIKNKDQYTFSLRTTEDLAPIIKILNPEKGSKYLTTIGKLPIKIEGRDDYGIRHLAMHVRKNDEGKIDEFVKKIYTGKNKNRVEKVVNIDAKNFKAKIGNTLEVNFSLWDTCNFNDPQLNKEMQCPHKVNTIPGLTKRITIISAEEFENYIDSKVTELKEKIDGIIQRQEVLLKDIEKSKGQQIPDIHIYDFLFKIQSVISDTFIKIRNELKDIYLDVVNNKLYPENKLIPEKLKEAYRYANILVDAKHENKGLLFDILRDIRVINEPNKINELVTNINNSLLLYNHILNILDQWESYQDLIRIIRQTKERQNEVKNILKGE